MPRLYQPCPQPAEPARPTRPCDRAGTAPTAVYAGRRIRPVCDNAAFHKTKAVRLWPAAHRDRLRVFRLPPYCPTLNLIERPWGLKRPWGHLKRTVLPDVLLRTLVDVVAAFAQGTARVNRRRDKMGFVFDHNDVRSNVA